MRVPSRRLRAGAITLLALGALVAGACTPPPEPTPTDWFEGGTYPVEVIVASRTVTTEFSWFGLATCTSTAVTPSVELRGTLTVAAVELDPAAATVTIPGASLELPSSTVSAGSWSLTCDGTHLGTIGVSLQFDAAASVRSVVLDPSASTLRLADPTLALTGIRATFAGMPPGTAPTPLAPVTVTVPTLDVPV